ncbi:cobalt-precorrin-5B (C(1))-methyltransferase CbiD [Cellulosilyticum ruminicola]|uniref:cobalt-precorrin-5B (C(1))-methyltransferase CbiD n=1 Tax=Cellulosilyticum ruminicola TaxID=425254 RepID=UPI0006D1ECCC|nr:cobalt-precorrin-5B (C(1))-methyltransferase CbiD [Cellulosilyticum ruminicola]
MEEFVYVDGKKYRRGYTTGSSATGAAKAAAFMLLTGEDIEEVQIDTPKGIVLNLKVHHIIRDADSVTCAIQKDGGDDVDATHGMMIYATVRWQEDNKITIDGGLGIGRITQRGLDGAVGEAAINKVPRQMISKEVRSVIGTNRGMMVVISAPEGVEIAKKTFNPRLGIMGGISILGTTGIVEPMSDEGWKRSLSVELEMKKAQGIEEIILVPGNHGERFVSNVLKIDSKHVVRMSNFVSYMLVECKRIGFKKIVIAGHLGKLIKVAAGIFHTHSRVADARSEIMIANLALMGVRYEILKEVESCLTIEATLEIIEREGLQEVYQILGDKCETRCKIHLQDESINIGVILFTMAGDELARSESVDALLERYTPLTPEVEEVDND